MPAAKPEPSMVVEGVTFTYPGDINPTVNNASLQLHKGRVVGIFGVNACGKTTLAKCMTQTIAPASGTVSCPVAQPAAASGAADEAWIMRAAVTVVLPIAAAAAAAEFAPRVLQAYPSLFAQLGQQSGLGKKAIEQALAPAAACCAALMVLVVLMLVRLVLLRRASGVAQKAWDDVVTFATSEDSPGTKMPQDYTIEKTIGEHMAGGLEGKNLREAVIVLLEESGFQRYNQETGEKEGTPRQYIEEDRLKLVECSGGQKQLIYALRQLAAARPVLLCDEVMIGLDMERQGRLLAMFRARRQQHAMLFITTDLHWMSVMCTEASDEVIFMEEGGTIVERRPGGREGGVMLSMPTSKGAKEYVSAFRSMLRDANGPLGAAIESEELKARYKIKQAKEKQAKAKQAEKSSAK